MSKEKFSESDEEAFLDDPDELDPEAEEYSDEAIEADELQALKAENGELKDRLLRALADVENVRKRGDRDRRDAELYASTRFARDLLSVHDNFDRALDNITDELRDTAPGLIEGIELTQRDLLNVFEKHQDRSCRALAGREIRSEAASGHVRGTGPRDEGRRHHSGDECRLHDRRASAAPGPGRCFRRRTGRTRSGTGSFRRIGLNSRSGRGVRRQATVPRAETIRPGQSVSVGFRARNPNFSWAPMRDLPGIE